VGNQQARRQKICYLLPEQCIQGRAALKRIRATQKQSGCNGVRMDRSLHKIARSGHVGFVGNALERCVRQVELNDIQRLVNVPS
jgi:hypothetical protein